MRDLSAAPPAWMTRDARPRPSWLLASMAPTATFLVVDAVAGVVPAILAASAVAAGLVLHRHRTGQQVGWVLPVSLGFVVFRGVLGVATRSSDVYFGVGVVASGAVALAVLATAFTRSPLAVHVIPLVKHYGPDVVTHPLYRRVAAHVTAAWGLCHLAVTSWEGVHLLRSSAAEFVAARSFVGWPVLGFVVFWCIFYLRARLDPLEHRLRVAAGGT
jgi:hypothetical protein